ncbi:hypothetical protein F5X68DRAFT_41181 [Plectosphaerella plurivora]|uniref:RING-type domain-containing protein n=1 Tax=Plectosphaerella plurivora TaxID=936078 RepID=A0A9P9A757_9PEZI|nr:hypothetical protein F5X68DRAFT_41181 [Plectosphaerella plurivora]
MLEYINLIDSDDELEVEMPPEPDACRATLRAVFPDMCPVFLEKIATLNKLDAGQAVDYVLDLPSYDKAPLGNKRKRSPTPKHPTPPPQDEVAKLSAIYDAPHRRLEPKGATYCSYAKKLLSHEFPRVKVDDIKGLMTENGNVLFATHRALVEIQEDWQAGRSARIGMKKTLTAPNPKYDQQTIQVTIRKESDPIKIELLQELVASRAALDFRNKACERERRELDAEEGKMSRARAAGNLAECECCCSEFIIDDMVSCNGDLVHFFCVDCARTNAEHVVGMTRHELKCMSTDGCSGGFSVSQRRRFLDDKLTAALDRIECEAVLCLAGLDDLERCPFCPFAAEYPSIEEDKEFRCGSDKCGIVSCRLCKQETHVPKSCEEVSKEKGMSARRQIEEAMSAAMIRKCNKCSTPFIKELGCNKMTCTRAACGNVQCYVCSKSCAYDHFDDVNRGGKKGNCPLFDDLEKRHEEEVEKAREVAQKKLAAEEPNINQEHLRINMSGVVAQDDERRKAAAKARAHHPPPHHAHHPPPHHGRAALRQVPAPVPALGPVQMQQELARHEAHVRMALEQRAQAPPPRRAPIQARQHPDRRHPARQPRYAAQPLAAQPQGMGDRNRGMPAVPAMPEVPAVQPFQQFLQMQQLPEPGAHLDLPVVGVSPFDMEIQNWNNQVQPWDGPYLNRHPPGHREPQGIPAGFAGADFPYFYDAHQAQAAPVAGLAPAADPGMGNPHAMAPNPVPGGGQWAPMPPY